MITPFLENLIIQGKARFKNWSCGYSQCMRIPVSDNDTAIITGFTYFPVILRGANFSANLFMQHLQIEGERAINDYCIKNSIIKTKFYDPDTQLTETIYSAGSPVKFDTYLVHNSDIKIRIAVANDPAGDILLQAPPPPSVKEQAPPLGFNGENIVLSAQLAGLTPPAIYNPLSKKEQPQVGNKEQLAINFQNNTLPDIAASIADYGYMGIPVLNFEIVFINKAFLNIGSNK